MTILQRIIVVLPLLIAACTAIKGSPTAEVYLDAQGHFRYVPAEDVGTSIQPPHGPQS
jgi:hypothetical protein